MNPPHPLYLKNENKGEGVVMLFVYYFTNGQVILGIPAGLGSPAGVRKVKEYERG